MLSEGSVVETGHPHLLLQAPAGAAAGEDASAGADGSDTVDATLSSMVEETGPVTAQHLRCLARKAWKASKGTQGSGVGEARARSSPSPSFAPSSIS